jgi:hypothetical protein
MAVEVDTMILFAAKIGTGLLSKAIGHPPWIRQMQSAVPVRFQSLNWTAKRTLNDAVSISYVSCVIAAIVGRQPCVPSARVQNDLHAIEDQAQLHTTLPAANQRQGREIYF